MEQTITKIQKEQPNSVEIGINAKGLYSGKVKIYSETIEKAFELAIIKSDEMEKLIKLKNNSI